MNASVAVGAHHSAPFKDQFASIEPEYAGNETARTGLVHRVPIGRMLPVLVMTLNLQQFHPGRCSRRGRAKFCL